MTRLTLAVAATFGVLLVVLAGIGAAAQLRLDRQVELLALKEATLVELAARRADAAVVNGPLAVTSWARATGMVPAPDAAEVVAVAPGLPPLAPAPLPTPALEVRTVWR
ncbi:MAG: hypothetical protein P1P87_09735 [Trueperaceae bacterium]|nr:hypothetical protein [Trueperaceae bacterium]